jgi:hypothetical protein
LYFNFGCLWVIAYRDKEVVGVFAFFVRRFIVRAVVRCSVVRCRGERHFQRQQKENLH